MPLLVLKKDGNRSTDIKLRKVFDYDYKVLKDGKKYSEGFFADMAESITKPIEDLKPKKAENTEDKKGLTAVAFFRIADAIKTSFMTDWIKLLNSRPNLLPMLNKVIKDKFQKEAYTKLSDGIKYKFNQNTIATDLSILNKINWIDLARIWHYQLGDLRGFGGTDKDTRLVFKQDAFTTQSIISHPGMKMVHEYARARVEADNTEEFWILLQYGPPAFKAAVRDNDVMQNLMGSFTIKAKSDKSASTHKIEYEIINELHLESATRFMEDHSGVISDQKRTDNSNTYLELGGTLYCQWVFSLPIITQK